MYRINTILILIWIITCTVSPPPIKMSDEWHDKSDQDVPWTLTWHQWLQVEPHQSSEVIRDNLAARFVFRLRTRIRFQSEGCNASCRLKMSTPVWSKNRSLLHKITPHRKFHKSPQRHSQPALHKGREMWGWETIAQNIFSVLRSCCCSFSLSFPFILMIFSPL